MLDDVNGAIFAIIALNSLFRLGFAFRPDRLFVCWPFTLSTTALPLSSVGGLLSPNAAAGSPRAVVADGDSGETALPYDVSSSHFFYLRPSCLPLGSSPVEVSHSPHPYKWVVLLSLLSNPNFNLSGLLASLWPMNLLCSANPTSLVVACLTVSNKWSIAT
jgi:hypothetical protein